MFKFQRLYQNVLAKSPKSAVMSVILILVSVPVFGAEGPEEGEPLLVLNRSIQKTFRPQLLLQGGYSGRVDFFSTYLFSAGARFHFSEIHAWEVIRVSYGLSRMSDVAKKLVEDGYHSRVQISKFQVSTAYVLTPFYGKFTWDGRGIFRADIYLLAGAGLRFTDASKQVFGQAGLGINIYPLGSHFSLTPEVRLRGYSEQRRKDEFILHPTSHMGVSWLF